jgi:hypothetical protein
LKILQIKLTPVLQAFSPRKHGLAHHTAFDFNAIFFQHMCDSNSYHQYSLSIRFNFGCNLLLTH